MRAFSTKWGQHREETSLAGVGDEGLQVWAAQTVESCKRIEVWDRPAQEIAQNEEGRGRGWPREGGGER